jgi:uncharacterized membrane protein YdjX (TVP38/TMEM64 family)
VKQQPTEWEKTFVNYIPGKGLKKKLDRRKNLPRVKKKKKKNLCVNPIIAISLFPIFSSSFLQEPKPAR